MKAFDKVIGYESIKNELKQICDMIHNMEVYERLGAKLPRGILLYGEPGLGKTLLAKSFIAGSGLAAYTVRRNKGADDFVGEITETFRKAKEHAPAIVFLDDMDKFANEDDNHCDAEEYVAVQAGIDEVKDAAVFVIATVNDIYKLPKSLTRFGRFDRKIEMSRPSEQDCGEIIKYYLRSKPVAEDVNLDDVAKMINYSSCAELETILNEAAINAAYARRTQITMKDMVDAVLRMEYEAPDDCTEISYAELQKVAYHEAGHVVVCEVLCPGSVGLVSLRTKGRDSVGGFVRRCKDLKRRPFEVMVSLAGKASVELHFADTCASGCDSDIRKAVRDIRTGMLENAICGFGFLDMEVRCSPGMSESMNARSEAVVYAELERYNLKVKDILLKNREFVEKVVEALLEKETLLYSDISGLRESVTIQAVAV